MKLNTRVFTVLLVLCIGLNTNAYSQNPVGSELHIKKAQASIILDGILDEADWQVADMADNWFDVGRMPLEKEILQ